MISGSKENPLYDSMRSAMRKMGSLKGVRGVGKGENYGGAKRGK